MRARSPSKSRHVSQPIWHAKVVLVRHWEADKLLAKLPTHLSFYLFFGSDAGLVNERLRLVLRQSIDDANDAFQLVRLEGDELASETGRLADECNTIGLFGGRRAIWVKAGSRNILPAIEAVMEAPLKDTVVLVEAGALKRDAALRKVFERERHAAAIECSHDDPQQLRALITEEARKSGLSIDRDTAELLSHSLGADRLTTRLELEKLLLYKHGEKEISMEDVEAVVADASALNLDAAINAAFSGRLEQVDQTVVQALAANNDAGMLIGMASRYAVMLHRARLDFERGVPRDSALEKASRKAFVFAQKDAMAAQFDSWSTQGLTRAIEILAAALSDCRKEARLAEPISIRAFWSIARAARRRRA